MPWRSPSHSSLSRPPATVNPPEVVSFLVAPPSGGTLGLTSGTVQGAQLAVSPDGKAMVLVAAAAQGRQQLFIRRFDDVELHPLPGTLDASYPFWSPDSRQIGFFADRQLKTIAVAGGPARPICEANNGRGGTWSSRGEIIFAPDNDLPLSRVSISDRRPSPLAALPSGHTGHRWPQFLPGEQRLLFFARSTEQNVTGIYVMSLDDPLRPQRLRGASTNGLYGSGHLLYIQEGVLVAERFDPQGLQLSGESVPLSLPVTGSSNFYSPFSVSDTGVHGDVGGRRIERARLVQPRRRAARNRRATGTLHRLQPVARREAPGSGTRRPRSEHVRPLACRSGAADSHAPCLLARYRRHTGVGPERQAPHLPFEPPRERTRDLRTRRVCGR